MKFISKVNNKIINEFEGKETHINFTKAFKSIESFNYVVRLIKCNSNTLNKIKIFPGVDPINISILNNDLEIKKYNPIYKLWAAYICIDDTINNNIIFYGADRF